MMGNMTFEEFEDKIRNTKISFSIRDEIKYVLTDYDSNKHMYSGVRGSTNKTFKFSVKDLYKCYCEKDHISIKVLKEYIKTRAQSPVYAVLIAAKLI